MLQSERREDKDTGPCDSKLENSESESIDNAFELNAHTKNERLVENFRDCSFEPISSIRKSSALKIIHRDQPDPPSDTKYTNDANNQSNEISDFYKKNKLNQEIRSTKTSEQSLNESFLESQLVNDSYHALFNVHKHGPEDSYESHLDDSVSEFNFLSSGYNNGHQINNPTNNLKTTYFNIMTIGASHLGKFSFIELLFDKCFHKRIKIGPAVKNVREFVHEINTKQYKRIITAIHSQGYKGEYTMEDWYRNIKGYIQGKMRTFDEVRKLWSKDKKLQRQAIVDCRVHLCLYFIESKVLNAKEAAYIRKLSEYVNIVPVLVQTRIDSYINPGSIKQEFICNAMRNDINWCEFGDTELVLQNITKELIGETPPFLIYTPDGKVCADDPVCDLNMLIKMLVTPYINLFHYKTEALWHTYIEDARETREAKMNTIVSNDNARANSSVSLAIAMGFIGAVIAMRSNII